MTPLVGVMRAEEEDAGLQMAATFQRHVLRLYSEYLYIYTRTGVKIGRYFIGFCKFLYFKDKQRCRGIYRIVRTLQNAAIEIDAAMQMH